ncbi:hypothetical protein MIMGU_mgv1a025398mg, partial [Erythranthe guttata]
EIRILGSCNGLIFIAINWGFFYFNLWNPFMGNIKEIPFLWNFRNFICGFGYVEYRSDDYKVVCIKKEKPYRTYIYSSKSNSWKNIEYFDKGVFLLNDTGKFVNGRLHWLAVQENGNREIILLLLICQVTTFCLNKNGDVAVAFGSNLLVVYGGKNVLRKSRVEMLDYMNDYVVYVESLVWPFGDEEVGI